MRRLLRPWTIFAVICSLVVVIAVVAVLHEAAKQGPDPKGIPAADGATLSAQVFTPKGSGPFPLLVMPAAWGAKSSQYAIIAPKLADDGYQVVAYTQRGFNASTGEIDFAAAPTRSDVSSVITWALKHTKADPKRIGAIGISYGAGASLLAAEHDPRIKAVVAMSGWADLAGALYPNQTVSAQALSELLTLATKTGRPGPTVSQLATDFTTKQGAAGVTLLQKMSPSRSAVTDVAALNKNHPAVMLANAYQDSIFPPSQIISFFNQITGPRRLQLAPGDHGGPEYSGALGKPNRTWDDAIDWLNHYLRGQNNGINRADPVQLENATSGAWHGYPNWASIGHATAKTLGPPGTTVGADAAGTWSATIKGGTDTDADSGPSNFDGTKTYKPPSGVRIASLPKADAAVWSGQPVTAATPVSGAASVQVNVASSTGSASLFCYLYDVDAAGNGTLMSARPYTIVGAKPNVARAVTVDLQPISWTVAAGHHLALAVDTMDPRYLSLSTVGSTITLSSSAANPARLTVPVSS